MNGAQGRNRTTDTAIFSRMLYQLSYLGAVRAGTLSPPTKSNQARQVSSPAASSVSASQPGTT